MFENSGQTDLSQLGEFGLIELLTKDAKKVQATTQFGIGDDAAVIDSGDRYTLVSTDMLLEGVHFNLSYAPLKHLGYKSVVVNLSDIYAMNGTPRQITVSIGVSSKFSVEALEEIYAGIHLACDFYQVDLIGGDTTSSKAGLVISVTAIGTVEKGKIAYRSGAKENDLICITGDLGGAYMGLQVLEREYAVFKGAPSSQPDLEGMDYILERQLKPEAQRGLVQLFEEKGLQPTSMIDVSDGLASELIHLAKASDLGATIYGDKVPVDHVTSQVAEEFSINPTVAALNGGEDYELLFTLPLASYEKIKDIPEIRMIGHMTEKGSGVYMADQAGNKITLEAQGWNAFKQE
jgi:thiamine-monophosphate kinase